VSIKWSRMVVYRISVHMNALFHVRISLIFLKSRRHLTNWKFYVVLSMMSYST